MDDLGLGGGLGWSHGDEGCDMVVGTEPGNMGLTQENRSTSFWLGYRETHWGREGGEDPNKARKL
jgi:hypothetical protein